MNEIKTIRHSIEAMRAVLSRVDFEEKDDVEKTAAFAIGFCRAELWWLESQLELLEEAANV